MYYKTTLKNGLTILKVPIRGAKSVLVDVFVKVGSRSENEKVNGISHFLEHLFFKGSQKFPTAQDLSHALDAIGASYNANTGKEHTQYYIKAARKHFRFIFETLTDVIHNPVFAEDEIEREKGVIVEEINMYQDTPIRHIEDLLEEEMWPRHPLGRNIAGTKEIIRSITRKDIAAYKEKFYQPGNIIIAVVGAFDDALTDKLVRKYWAGLANKSFPAWKKAVDRQKSPVVKFESKPTEQYHMSFGFRGYDYNHKNNAAQLVLATVLGGGMSSRLFTEVRERRGLAYYVQAGPGHYQDTGNFMIKAGVRLGALEEAVTTIINELKKIKADRLESREMTKAKEYIKGTMTLALEDHENLLGWYLEQTAFRDRILEPDKFFEKIDRVSTADLAAVAGDLFRNNKANLVVIGPRPKQESKIKKMVKL